MCYGDKSNTHASNGGASDWHHVLGGLSAMAFFLTRKMYCFE